MTQASQPEPAALRFHHTGLVVRSIEPVAEYYQHVLGYSIEGPVQVDPLQKVRIQFLSLGTQLIELLEPLGADSPISGFLEKGGGLHHFCYECDDIHSAILFLKHNGAAVASHPKPASAMNHREVAFMVTKHRHLVELLGTGTEAGAERSHTGNEGEETRR